MALPRISKSHQNLLKSINPISPPFFSLISTNNPTPSSNPPRPICTKTHSDPVLPNPDVGLIADGLISIFAKQPFSPDNPTLNHFASRITPKTVECVLNGLKSWKVAQFFFTWASNQSGYTHNCYTYNAMASHLSRARQNAAMRALAMELVDSSCYMTPGALGFFLRCLGSVGLIEEANNLFDRVCVKGLCVPSSYVYNCLLEAVSKSGSVEMLERRMKEMRDCGLGFDRYTLTPALKVYCNAGKFKKALTVYQEMHEKRWVDDYVMAILVVSFSKWGEVDKAFELIERMEHQNLCLNDKTFRVLIHGFVRESRVDKALQLFEKMRMAGLSVDVSLYSVLIEGLCKNKEIEKAWSMYLEMKDLGIESDVRVLRELILASSNEGEMIQIFEKVQDDLNEEDMFLLCSSVLNDLVNNGCVDRAYQLMQAMIGKEPDADQVVKTKVRPTTILFQIVIDGLLKFGKLPVALSLLEDMNQIGCKPNVVIYNNVIDELCKSNSLEESYKLLGEMEQSGVEPTHFTHNSIFGCLCRREDVQGALALVKEMHVCGHEPWEKYTTLLVKQLCKHGKAAQACRFLDKMVEVRFLPRLVSYSAVIDGLFKSQEVDRALQLFKDVCADGYCPDVVFYNILINGLCRAKRVLDAENFLNEMVMKGLVPSVVSYNLMINGYCKNGDVDKAMKCLSRIFAEARGPNVITYTMLIDGLCNAGRIDDALVLWNDMAKKGCAPNRISFTALINGFCKCGKPTEALAYLRNMQEKEMKPDIHVYSVVTSALISNLNLPPAT